MKKQNAIHTHNNISFYLSNGKLTAIEFAQGTSDFDYDFCDMTEDLAFGSEEEAIVFAKDYCEFHGK